MKKASFTEKTRKSEVSYSHSPDRIKSSSVLSTGKLIALEEFINLDPKDINIYVVKPIKKAFHHTVRAFIDKTMVIV